MTTTYWKEGQADKAHFVFVGEAPARNEILLGHPFVGPAGELFDDCLMKAQISRRDCFITNVFNCQVEKDQAGNYFDPEGILLYTKDGWFTTAGEGHIQRLKTELMGVKRANTIVALGNPALRALTGKTGITNHRGSIWENTLVPRGPKVIPSIHPAGSLRGMYVWRYFITQDFRRAKRENAFKEIRRPTYRFNLTPTFDQIKTYLMDVKATARVVAFDIEIENRCISRISFARSATEAMSVSFTAGWSEAQEVELWNMVSDILSDPAIDKICQYGMFDISMLYIQMNILTRGRICDTFYAHHLMYPDFPGSLAFLCSMYTDQPYYKDMVKFSGKDIHNPQG